MFSLKRKTRFLLFLLLGLGLVYYFFPAKNLQHVVSPIVQALSRSTHFFSSFYHEYLALHGAKQKSLALSEEVQGLKSEVLRLQEENRTLQGIDAHYQQSALNPSAAMLAHVVAYDPSLTHASLTIDRGSEDGVRVDQIILASGGLIGRVLKVNAHDSQILLITDLNSSVDVIDARTRARGLLVGLRKQMGLKRERWLTQAEYVSSSEEIEPGDLMLSSGLDGIFPKGLPVGLVSQVQKDASGLFWKAEVEPYTELNKLEEVLVLDTKRGDG